VGINVDFRRICRFDSGLSSLSDSLLKHWELKKEGCNDELRIIVKSMSLSKSVDKHHAERRIEDLMNLRHPCISGVIGLIFQPPFEGLQIIEIYSGDNSLSKVISTSPAWWTPTAKAKAIVGLVLGLRFAHSLGAFHGHLTVNNIHLNEDRIIHICDFCMNVSGEFECDQGWMLNVEGISKGNWMPKVDVQAFVGLLSEIAVDSSAKQSGRGQYVPPFISKMIERGQSADSTSLDSFADIFKTLKCNKFQIMEGVDVKEVSDFVNWIEWSEAFTK
jgi:serine/threonine protein kinase